MFIFHENKTKTFLAHEILFATWNVPEDVRTRNYWGTQASLPPAWKHKFCLHVRECVSESGRPGNGRKTCHETSLLAQSKKRNIIDFVCSQLLLFVALWSCFRGCLRLWFCLQLFRVGAWRVADINLGERKSLGNLISLTDFFFLAALHLPLVWDGGRSTVVVGIVECFVCSQ